MPPGGTGLTDPAPRQAAEIAEPWLRAAAAAAVLATFWADTRTPNGIAVPVLYVVPVLLFIWAGRFWEPFVVAVTATVLTAAGLYLSPAGGSLEIAQINRPIEALIVWVTAALVGYYRWSHARWMTQMRQERAEREASLARLEELRFALDQAAIVAATDHRGIITYANDKFCEISKYSREELLGQTHRIVNSGLHTKEFFQDLWRTISQGAVWRGEIRNRAKDGTLYWVDTTIVPFLDDRGRPRLYLAIRSDITQRKLAQAQLAAQAALTQLGQLATVVAHEVRNPLAGLRASLEVLGSRLAPEQKEREVIRAMIERIDVLNTKVGDILRFARPATPALRPIDISPIVADAVASARASAGADCPEIRSTVEPLTVFADLEMLQASLLNLLLNACQSGGQIVEVIASAAGDGCRISVLDRGSGIPDEHVERVFDAFYTTKKTGTGLGLPIVRRLIALQQGTIALRSRPGGGTIAEVMLPLARPIAAAGSVSRNAADDRRH
jgi:two-component system CheB/CheR fusion protein